MKTEIIKADVQYIDPELEAHLKSIQDGLIATVELQGRHDGAQSKPKTVEEHTALILNFVEVKLQEGINYIHQRYSPKSGVAVARMVELDANRREQELQGSINDAEHALPKLVAEAKSLQPDVKHIAIRKWILAGLVLVPMSEGFTAYPAFRHFGFFVLTAILASVSVAIGVAVGTHFSGGFIKDAKNRAQRIARYAISLVPAIIGFGVLGYMRARAYSHVPTLAVGTPHVSTHPNNILSGLAIAVISVILYWAGLILSSHYFRTDAESIREHAYEEKCKEVEAVKSGITGTQAKIVKIQSDKATNMALAIKMFTYAQNQEAGLVGFAQTAAENYKQKNMRHRTDGCPPFFSQKPVFNFTTFFNNVKTQEYAKVD